MPLSHIPMHWAFGPVSDAYPSGSCRWTVVIPALMGCFRLPQKLGQEWTSFEGDRIIPEGVAVERSASPDELVVAGLRMRGRRERTHGPREHLLQWPS